MAQALHHRGVHGEKLVAAYESKKLPASDKSRMKNAISKYDKWVYSLNSMKAVTTTELIYKLVNSLSEYKYSIDVDLIFDSENDFLYRQKGQMKLDNTVIEEFLPLFVTRCLEEELGQCPFDISSQAHVFSSMYFESSLATPTIGGGIRVKTKDQDFSISKPLYLKASHSKSFNPSDTVEIVTALGYTLAELKTNLDKTMFQEASATAHDTKIAIPGSKYYLLCDFLDMKPISTDTTDIEEIFILRKAKRIGSSIRSQYSTRAGRINGRNDYIDFLQSHPYSPDLFERFIDKLISQIQSDELKEDEVLNSGYF